MRKYLLVVLVLLALCLCISCSAETLLSFDSIHAQITLDESKYIILTQDNLDKHQEWMSNRNITPESLLEDWNERGVLLQAWTLDSDSCLELTAVTDEWSEKYFDLDQQTKAIRASYRSAHLKGTIGSNDGYKYQSAEWKNTDQYGRFLMLKYKRTSNGTTTRGYARRAVRNGYTITLDNKVFGRALKTQDLAALNKAIGTWHFTTVLPVTTQSSQTGEMITASNGTASSAGITANAIFTSEPPAETNTGSFKVKGTCTPNLHLIAVLMRMSSSEPLRLETDASKKGNFTIDVKLPEEGTWLMTLTFKDGTQTVGETVFHTTSYSSTTLPVNLDHEVPEVFPSDKYTLSGKTIKGVTIQCIVEGAGFSKQVKTNNSGAFSFKIPTEADGDYHIILTFQKKGYATRRFTYNVKREMTAEQKNEVVRSTAVKPAYSTLTKKLTNYVGRYMTYNLYLTDIVQNNEEWVLFMAMRSLKTGYKDIVVVTTTEDPGNLAIGSQYRIYGQLVGNYEVQNAEGGSSYYPCFELLFFGA
ncbi:MAG: hypothetical protein K6A68_00595 [Clostridiales bacterium]|nr:hypothetical protein [Clostridiales bacterium]